jgi:hypothetical protein
MTDQLKQTETGARIAPPTLASAHAALAAADAVIARVKGRIGAGPETGCGDARGGALQPDTLEAFRIAREWELHVVQIVADAKAEEAVRRFREQWPAIVHFRDRVLTSPERETAATVAAAYELLALEATLADDRQSAAEAQFAAFEIMQDVRPLHVGRNTVLARSA